MIHWHHIQITVLQKGKENANERQRSVMKMLSVVVVYFQFGNSGSTLLLRLQCESVYMSVSRFTSLISTAKNPQH